MLHSSKMPRRVRSLTIQSSTFRVAAGLLLGLTMLLGGACSSQGDTPGSTAGAPAQAGAFGQAGGVGVAGMPPGVGGSAASAGATSGGSGMSVAGMTGLGGVDAGGNTAAAGAAGTAQAGQAGASTEDLSTPKPSPGCSANSAPADGNHNLTANAARSYLLRKPQGYSAQAQKAWPLVLALHPNGPAADYWDGTTGVHAIRPLFSDKAILVMPQAVANDWRTNVADDLAYFDTLISELENTMCIDMHRIFAMGHSGGGSYSGVLGCMRPDIRAFSASGAVIYFDKAMCVGKAAAWITIGVDEAIPERIDYRDFFRTFAGCAETSKSVTPSGCVVYDCPDPKRPIEFCSHVGGHEWPDSGSLATVDFFKQF